MKKLNLFLSFLLCALFCLSAVACELNFKGTEKAETVDGDNGIHLDVSGRVDGVKDAYISDGLISGEGGVASESGSGAEYASGLITAMAWDDNANYGLWTELFYKGQGEEDTGKFAYYSDGKESWGFNTLNRVKVTVKNNDGTPACGVKVYLESENDKQVAKTDNRGIAFLFPAAESGTVTVNGEEKTFDKDCRELSFDLSENAEKAELINIMLVVDVTGSMGDELEFLKSELKDVVNRTAALVDGAKIRLSLLFYRDDEDEEEFRFFDFADVTDEQNLNAKIKEISSQRADGGGDYPEAVDAALTIAMEKEWGEENSTNIIFHVLDAPPHSEEKHRTTYNAAINAAATKGIRICPILCSGADGLTEYLIRQAAIFTGGTSIFVTDHSGIGETHLDPELPNAVVEKLNDLMIRLISGYYNGVFDAPVAYNVSSKTTQNND